LSKRRLNHPELINILALVILILSLLPFSSVQAQARGLTMEVSTATDGYFKYGEWLPLWVQLENTGPDVDVEIQVRVTGSSGSSVYAAPAPMPSGARKRVPLYVLPNNFSHEIEVQAVSEGAVLATRNLPIVGLANITFTFGMIAPEQGALSLIKGLVLPGRVRNIAAANLSLRDLPDRSEGLSSFDVIIINDSDTSQLSNDQKTALSHWVRQGGQIVVGGGAGAMRTAAGIPEELLALIPNNLIEVSALPEMAAFAESEPIQNPGPFTMATGEAGGSRIVMAAGNQPVVLEKKVGSGAAYFIALDLATAPFNGWPGTTAFWEKLFGPAAIYPDWLPPDMSNRQMSANQMNYALSTLPALDLPSIQTLAVLLGFYIVMVGPVNYGLLRWKKRLHWAWITIPVLTIAFSAGAFGIGYLLRGNDIILNKIAIVNPQSEGAATLRTYFGLFSPAQQSYQIELNSGGLLSPIRADYDPWTGRASTGGSETVFVQGSPAFVRGLSVDQWSMQAFMTEGVWEGLGDIQAVLDFTGNAVVGTLRNETGITLNDVALVFGANIQRFESLAPGDEVPVYIETPNLVGPDFGNPLSYRLFESEFSKPMPSGPPRELQLKQTLIDNLFSYGFSMASSSRIGGKGGSIDATNLLFVGWFDQAPPELKVAGRLPASQTTGLLYMNIPYRFPNQGRLAIPAGLISGTVVTLPTEGGTCGPPGTPAIYLGRGESVLDFTLPDDFQDLKIDNLILQITSEGGWDRAPNTAVYDWGQDEWDELENPTTGPNMIQDIRGLVSESNQVRVRIASPEGFTGACYYLGLGLEGSW
jgi:hypothetical protein